MTEKILFFCENRNAVHLADALAGALSDAGHDVVLATADPHGEVARWVVEEAAGLHLAVDNLLPHVAAGTDWREEVTTAVRGRLLEGDVARVVLFNDRSQRGRRVVAAARGLVPVVLVQDGHLDFLFRSVDPSRPDQNADYGSSGVSAIAVWGATTERFIVGRDAVLTASVHVTGALGISDDPRWAEAAAAVGPVLRRRSGPVRVLLADQPLADQGKTSREVHQRLLREIAAAAPELTVKPHPSSSARHLQWLREQFPGAVLEPARGLPGGELTDHDVVVTFFSSIWTDAVLAGVPVIFFCSEHVGVVMPRVAHPLVRHATDPRSLGAALTGLGEGQFRGNFRGKPLDQVVAVNHRVAQDVADVVLSATVVPPDNDDSPQLRNGIPDDIPEHPVAPRLPAGKRVAVLADQLSYRFGVGIPVRTLLASLDPEEKKRVRVVDPRAYANHRELSRALKKHDVVIVNSLAPFWRQVLVADAVRETLRTGRTRVVVYAHETGWVLDHERDRVPERHAALLDLLPRLDVWCVSAAQAELFAGLGARRVTVVLNTEPGVPARAGDPTRTRSPRRVVMAGTVQERKGPRLFGEVAEAARARGLDLEFVWIGEFTRQLGSEFVPSPAVQWRGRMDRGDFLRLLADSDVLFLSSRDDPMPLVVLEAVGVGARVVTFDQVGSHEVLDGVGGYASFPRYDAASALQAIERVLADEVDVAGYDQVLARFRVEALKARVVAALEVLLAEPGPGPVGAATARAGATSGHRPPRSGRGATPAWPQRVRRGLGRRWRRLRTWRGFGRVRPAAGVAGSPGGGRARHPSR